MTPEGGSWESWTLSWLPNIDINQFGWAFMIAVLLAAAVMAVLEVVATTGRALERIRDHGGDDRPLIDIGRGPDDWQEVPRG